jgi:hypothetical protein
MERDMTPILTKRRNYELCHAGAYGNRLQQWDSIEAWMASSYASVAMRVALEVGGGPKAFHVAPRNVEVIAELWGGLGVRRDQIRLAEMADGRRVLQGQYANDFTGEFLHTFKTGPMPEALAKSHAYSFGLHSRLLLRAHMTPSSYADFEVLLEQYPDHVFELSVWASCLGDTPGRNAIVWEVRRY